MPLVDDIYPEERGVCQAWKDWLHDPCFEKVRATEFYRLGFELMLKP